MLIKQNKFIFNAHLILSIIAVIPLFIIVATAPFVSYRVEIANLIDYSKMHPKNVGEKMGVSEALNKLKEQINFDSISKFEALNFDSAYRIRVVKNRQNQTYILDPFSGNISESVGEKISYILLMLHRNLGLALIQSDENLAGKIGKQIVAISSIIMAFLFVSGVWLYMPIIRQNFIQSLKFSTKARGHSFFYKFHASLGLATGALLFIMAITGLYWSYGFVRDGAISLLAGSEALAQSKKIKREKPLPTPTAKFSEIGYVVEVFNKKEGENFNNLSFSIPKPDDKIYTLNFNKMPENSALVMTINADSGEINVSEKSSQLSPARKAHVSIYKTHTGEILGTFGQILFAVICLIGLAIIISGFMMTFRRINRK